MNLQPTPSARRARLGIWLTWLLLSSANSTSALATTQGAACAVTLDATSIAGAPMPAADWYGSEALAVVLPKYGVLATAASPASLSAKLYWFSKAYRPGMESELVVDVRSIDGTLLKPRITAPMYGGGEHKDDDGPWAMSMGIAFFEPGCWRVSGSFLEESLDFVVEVRQRPADR